jgi:hypothetical protein
VIGDPIPDPILEVIGDPIPALLADLLRDLARLRSDEAEPSPESPPNAQSEGRRLTKEELIRRGYTIVGEEIQIEFPDGRYVRADFVAERQGQLLIVEVKDPKRVRKEEIGFNEGTVKNLRNLAASCPAPTLRKPASKERRCHPAQEWRLEHNHSRALRIPAGGVVSPMTTCRSRRAGTVQRG